MPFPEKARRAWMATARRCRCAARPPLRTVSARVACTTLCEGCTSTERACAFTRTRARSRDRLPHSLAAHARSPHSLAAHARAGPSVTYNPETVACSWCSRSRRSTSSPAARRAPPRAPTSCGRGKREGECASAHKRAAADDRTAAVDRAAADDRAAAVDRAALASPCGGNSLLGARWRTAPP